MRWSVSVPVTWPTQQGFDTWWRGVVNESLADPSLADPSVSEQGVAGQGLLGDEVALVTGEHLRPGAVYRWLAPEGAKASAAWGIGGRPQDRDAYAQFQNEPDSKRNVIARVGGLEVCRGFTATSTLEHLDGEVSFAPDRDRLLDVEVRLDWLLFRLRARVGPGESEEQLRVNMRLVGRGIWRPVIAPFLVMLRPIVTRTLTAEVEEAADRLTNLDTDPRGDGAPERDIERIRAGAEMIRQRLHEVVASVAAHPWWRRGTGQLTEAFQALPALGEAWPQVTPVAGFGDSGRWWGEEQWIFNQVIEVNPPRRRRHAEVDNQVDMWLGAQEHAARFAAAERARLEAADRMAPKTPPTAEELNRWLDLAWLATPWSTVRFLVSNAAEPEDDIPTLTSDEDARRYLTDLLKDL